MKSKYWAIVIAGIMIASFVFAGLFYVESGLFNHETGDLNDKMVYELHQMSVKISTLFGAHLETCPYDQWTLGRQCYSKTLNNTEAF